VFGKEWIQAEKGISLLVPELICENTGKTANGKNA